MCLHVFQPAAPKFIWLLNLWDPTEPSVAEVFSKKSLVVLCGHIALHAQEAIEIGSGVFSQRDSTHFCPVELISSQPSAIPTLTAFPVF